MWRSCIYLSFLKKKKKNTGKDPTFPGPSQCLIFWYAFLGMHVQGVCDWDSCFHVLGWLDLVEVWLVDQIYQQDSSEVSILVDHNKAGFCQCNSIIINIHWSRCLTDKQTLKNRNWSKIIEQPLTQVFVIWGFIPSSCLKLLTLTCSLI